jgi:hypothetical protein
MKVAATTIMGVAALEHVIRSAADVRTGGDDDRDLVARDSEPRMMAAYVLVQVARLSMRAALALVPKDHPWYVAVGGTVNAVDGQMRRHPRWGLVSRRGSRNLTRNLWVTVALLVVALLVSDSLAIGPVDLGLIHDQHIGLHHLLHLPWWGGADQNAPDFFGLRLPW